MSRPFLQHYLPFLLVRADTLLSERWMTDLAASGHSVAEWRILAALADTDDVTIGELAELVLLPQPTVSRWVDRLEGRGFVRRSDGDTDRRRTHVCITPAGTNSADAMAKLAERRLHDALAGITPDDAATLEQLLRRVIASLSAG